MSSTKKARNALSLKKKYDLIEMRKKNPHITSRILADKFNCGKTQVNTILAHQDNIESNMNPIFQMIVLC